MGSLEELRKSWINSPLRLTRSITRCHHTGLFVRLVTRAGNRNPSKIRINNHLPHEYIDGYTHAPWNFSIVFLFSWLLID